MSPDSEHCDASDNCWTYDSEFESHFASEEFAYGYQSTTLGTLYVGSKDAYAGAALSTQITATFTTSHPNSDMRLYAQRLNTSGSSVGVPSTPKQQVIIGKGTFAQDRFAVLYENTSKEQSIWHEVDWWIPGYPGHWYVFQKSIEAYKTSAGGYEYYSQPYVPPVPVGISYSKS